MSDSLYVDDTAAAPSGGSPISGRKENIPLAELAKDFHLFTLGPVYTGAQLDVNLLEVFAEQEGFKFEAVTAVQPFQMFKNLNEWDFLVQGIERTKDEADQENSAARNFAQFMQGWDFVRRPTRFYAKVYSRPVQIVPPGVLRGTPVEVFLLASNKGTQEIKGANPYEIIVDPVRIAPYIKRDADKVLEILGG